MPYRPIAHSKDSLEAFCPLLGCQRRYAGQHCFALRLRAAPLRLALERSRFAAGEVEERLRRSALVRPIPCHRRDEVHQNAGRLPLHGLARREHFELVQPRRAGDCT